ncbi:MAG: hydroxysqualene dehydroxylase HpnE [Candidatus Acetothermia bacterium]
MDSSSYQTLIVGGGLAGIAAATELVDRGLSVYLIEQSPSLGGRTTSFKWKGRRLDNGQHLHAACYNYYLELLRKIGLQDEVFNQEYLRVPFRHLEGTSATLRHSRLPPPFHLAPSLFSYPFINSLQRAITGIISLRSLLTFSERMLDRQTFGDWLERYGVSEKAQHCLWEPVIKATLNGSVDSVSLKMGLMIIRKVLLSKNGGRLGYLQCPLSEIGKTAQTYIEARGGKVQTGRTVEEIVANDEQFEGLLLDDGTRVQGETCICAVPGHELKNLLRYSLLPAISDEVRKLDWNSIINVHIYGPAINEETMLGCLGTVIQWLFNQSLMHSSEPGHYCLTISDADKLIPESSSAIIELVTEELKALFPETKLEITDTAVLKYPRATFLPLPGSEHHRPKPNTDITGLYLAGDWTDTGWPSTMEGAVRSGVKAGQMITNSS